MAATKKPKQDGVNEFNQAFKPVSLWADAWKRLRKNRMALMGLWVVGFYVLVTVFAPVLTSTGIIYDYAEQNLVHVLLRPSLRPSGELAMERLERRIVELEETLAAQGGAVTGESGQDAYSFFDQAPAEPAAEGGEGSAEGDAYGFFNQAPASEGAEGGSEADDSAAAAFGSYGTTDPIADELASKKADLAALAEEVAKNPLHRRVYVLGTDDLGRDMLARIIYGGRISIMIGIVGAITAALIGILVGSVAGYVGGWLDSVLMRFVDIMYGLPYMLIVIIIMAMIGDSARGSFVILFVAIALVSWLTMARVVRGQVLSLKNSEYVEAARSMGASTPRIIFRHLLPNTLGVIIVYSTLMMPSFIMNESFLSFLGLGVSAPNASWGTLVSEGVRGMQLNPHQLLVPAIAMTFFLFSMNFLGDGLRDALDPQSKNRT